MVNGSDDVFVEREGRIERVPDPASRRIAARVVQRAERYIFV